MVNVCGHEATLTPVLNMYLFYLTGADPPAVPIRMFTLLRGLQKCWEVTPRDRSGREVSEPREWEPKIENSSSSQSWECLGIALL